MLNVASRVGGLARMTGAFSWQITVLRVLWNACDTLFLGVLTFIDTFRTAKFGFEFMVVPMLSCGVWFGLDNFMGWSVSTPTSVMNGNISVSNWSLDMKMNWRPCFCSEISSAEYYSGNLENRNVGIWQTIVDSKGSQGYTLNIWNRVL